MYIQRPTNHHKLVTQSIDDRSPPKGCPAPCAVRKQLEVQSFCAPSGDNVLTKNTCH